MYSTSKELESFTAVLRFCYRKLSFVLREVYRALALRMGYWAFDREVVAGRRIQQSNEELHVLCSSPCVIRMLRRDWRVTCQASVGWEMRIVLRLEDGTARGHFEYWGLDGSVKLKWILKELNVRTWTELLCLWTGMVGGRLWTHQWDFCFHEVWVISWLAEELCCGSRGGIPPTEIVEL